MKTEENYTNKIINNLKDYFKQNQIENYTNPSFEDKMRLVWIHSPKKIIKNSWYDSFGDLNKRMSKKLDSLLFSVSNKLFFFESFILIKNKSLKHSNKNYYTENNQNKYSYLENGIKRELDYYGKSFFYEIIDYKEFLNHELEYKVISNGVLRFYLFSLGEKSYYFEELKTDIPRLNMIFDELILILNSQYSIKKNKDYQGIKDKRVSNSEKSISKSNSVKTISSKDSNVFKTSEEKLNSKDYSNINESYRTQNYPLQEKVLSFVKTLPKIRPGSFSSIISIEKEKEGLFSRSPYKGWMLPGVICGFRKHRVTFDEYSIEIIKYSYPESNINPKLFYFDICSNKSKTFFNNLKDYVKYDQESVIYLQNKLQDVFEEWLIEKKIKENEKKNKEIERVSKLTKSISSNLEVFDKDGNGELDTVEVKSDFDKLVKKHQKKIIEIDRNYIQQFVKISNYQKLKRENLQKIFESISKSQDQKNLDETIELLKERIHSYELILLHSLCMVTCLVEDDMFTFYEIYESFDKLKIFKSDHENEVSDKLTNIEIGIYDLMFSIRSMEKSLIKEIGHLTYVTQGSFKELSTSVTKQLSSIGSSIKFNNLLTGIQTYQTYKINKNTKSLRG